MPSEDYSFSIKIDPQWFNYMQDDHNPFFTNAYTEDNPFYSKHDAVDKFLNLFAEDIEVIED